ncbi:MAG TPA: GldG family protein [Verrucomicrobiae bacterium]|nr:GldG family protein [Verrucomicrobiae bacterium]
MQKKSLETLLYSTVGVIVMAVILIAVNIITGAFRERIDLTKEKAYTLSDGTKAILSQLDTPVKIRFYCTQSETATPYSVLLKSYAKKVEDLLAEYKQASHGKLVIEKYDPQPDSDAEDSARLDGVEEQALPGGEKFYLGLAVSQLDTKESIPFLSPDRERQLEYDISRAISRVVKPEKPVIGVMSGLPVFGQPSNPMMQQMGQRGQEPWAIINELKSDYTVRTVEMDADKIDDEIKLLFVIHPKDISDKAQYAIDQFVLRGGRLVAFLDAQSLLDSSRSQNPMMGAMPGGGSSLDKLLKAWGLQFDTSKVVADRSFQMEVGAEGDQSQKRPSWLMLTSEGINNNDIATSELDSIWYFSGGAFTGSPAPGLKETVLLKSTKDSELVDGMTANFGAENILRDFKPSGIEYALAVRLTGKFKTAFPEGKPAEKSEADADKKADEKSTASDSLKESKVETTVVLIGDADMISDNFSIRRMNTPFGQIAQPMNANLNFAQNVLEQLSGDSNLIAVRSRAVLNRPFTRVKAMQAEAEEKYMAQIKELQESRDQTVSRLSQLQQQKNQNQRYILSPEQQAEIENLRKKEGEIGKKLRQVEKDLRREVVGLQRRIQWYNILTVPLAVGVVGILLAIYKQKRTSAK